MPMRKEQVCMYVVCVSGRDGHTAIVKSLSIDQGGDSWSTFGTTHW